MKLPQVQRYSYGSASEIALQQCIPKVYTTLLHSLSSTSFHKLFTSQLLSEESMQGGDTNKTSTKKKKGSFPSTTTVDTKSRYTPTARQF